MWALLLACAGGAGDTGTANAPDGVLAIVDADRPQHFFDLPFPSDDLLVDGRPDLAGYPLPTQGPLAGVLEGWRSRLEQVGWGFAANGAAYFRFEAPLEGLPAQTTGAADDVVAWVSLTGDPELVPLDVRWVQDPGGDPSWGDNTLAFGPQVGFPARSGGTYAAVVMAEAGVRAPDGYQLPDGVADALAAAGATGTPAVATVFTVQDSVGQLHALTDDVDQRLSSTPDWSGVTLRRVVRLSYGAGTTPSGNDATLATVTFEDGGTEVTYLAAGGSTFTVELDDSWPLAVYQATLPTLNYSGLDDRPYMSPGLAHLGDVDRTSGWITFDSSGAPLPPDDDQMRIVVSLPHDAADAPVVIWDHGTGGHAYNAVQRRYTSDDGRTLAQAAADAGVAIISRDAPLYGTRFPLIDEGYGASLGYYNIVNLPAFRDNQRQTAVDGHVLQRFVETGLSDLLPADSIDPSRLRRGGHSLGSVTGNLGLAMDPDAYDAAFLSGSGGVFTHYFLDTGLLGTSIDPGVLDSLFALLGVDPPDQITTQNVLGAALSLPEDAWPRLDRLHPALQLFQWTMDPSDPMAVARHIPAPATMLVGDGDYQVPNFTSDALCDTALPDCSRTTVQADGNYDPHFVLYRTDEGAAVWAGWVGE